MDKQREQFEALKKLELHVSRYEDGKRYCDFCSGEAFPIPSHKPECPVRIAGEVFSAWQAAQAAQAAPGADVCSVEHMVQLANEAIERIPSIGTMTFTLSTVQLAWVAGKLSSEALAVMPIERATKAEKPITAHEVGQAVELARGAVAEQRRLGVPDEEMAGMVANYLNRIRAIREQKGGTDPNVPADR